jgi:hypothetical protein
MKYHGIGKLLCDVFSDVNAFEVKLDLLHKHVSEQNLNHSPCYKIVLISASSPCDWRTQKDKFVLFSSSKIILSEVRRSSQEQK